MDCLDRSLSETETPPPFQHLVTEQAKSFIALQELQNEVGALLEFRDLVMESFPHLRVKMEHTTTTPTQSHLHTHTSSHSNPHSNKWEPGVRVRRKLGGGGAGGSGGSSREDIVPSLLPRSRSNSHGKGPKSGENSSSAGSSAVQDSGFCTESKEHSATSSKNKEVEDELMNLLDMIQAKGTALRLEVEYLQNQLVSSGPDSDVTTGTGGLLDSPHSSRPPRRKCRSLESFPPPPHPNYHAPSSDWVRKPPHRDELFGLKKERDELTLRIVEMEEDSAHNLAQTNALLAEVGQLSAEKRYLEERLATLHSQSSHWRGNTVGPCFTPVKHYEVDEETEEMLSSTNPYTETGGRMGGLGPPGLDPHSTPLRPSDPLSRKFNHYTPSPSPSPCIPKTLGTLDGIVSSPSTLMRSPRGVKLSRYKTKMAAILRETNRLELQRHLLTTVFQNEVLTYQVDNITKSRVELVCQLAKIKEENEDLKFQLEEKNIELEGTRARVRLYERLQTVKMGGGESHTLIPPNPILPQLTLPCGGETQPLSSSTESAHHDDSASGGSSMDKLNSVNRSPSKRRTSKIPLKYSAPKHPGDGHKHAAPPGTNSSIPKYQKDTSSWQSRKSGDSLNGVPSVTTNQSTRNWESHTKTTSSHVVKKPAILSNKELTLAQNRRDSTGLNNKSSAHVQGKGAPPSARMRKTSSESSNSSSSSPRYARDPPPPGLKKHTVRPSQPGPEPKVRPAAKFSNFLTSWIKSSGLS
uniref:Uncharacterized protein n=1 Tax=Cacopsylla melanoneura TaxID=428564 RepID=A0A8D8UZ81_9HEMI